MAYGTRYQNICKPSDSFELRKLWRVELVKKLKDTTGMIWVSVWRERGNV
jgi:hypothetical protein